MSELQNGRTVQIIAAEINALTATMLSNIIEIGRRMCEAKEMLPHGAFGKWVEEATGYSHSTANNFMNIYREYGAAQGCLFGAEANSQTIGKLSYTKALALLAIPADERESFVEENHVEDMSVKELKKAIQERDEALERAKNLQEDLEEKQKGLDADMEALTAELAAVAQDKAKMAEDMDFLNKRVAGLNDEVAQREKELEELRSRPVEVAVQEADPAELERAREEGAAAAQEAAAQELQKAKDALAEAKAKEKEAKNMLKELKKQMAQAEEREQRAWADAERARKEAQAAGDKELAEFSLLFEQTQEMVNKMSGIRMKLEQSGRSDHASKLGRALEALAQAVEKAARAGEVSLQEM